MKQSLNIAKLQLANLLYSPISWAVLIVFALYSGISFTDSVEGLFTWFKQAPDRMANVTSSLFLGEIRGYFFSMNKLMFLFIPIISMGLISNEMNSGTIKLLYSSSIKLRSIVIGKYIAMLVYSLLIAVLMLLVVLGAGLFIPQMDWPVLLVALLGFFLLNATYSAVGIFMSSLSRYQVISGISTIALLFSLDYISGLGQETPVLRDILHWIGISNHTSNILQGYLISSDVFYFIIISCLFLVFTINKMKADRVGTSGKYRIGAKMAGVIAVAGLAIFILTQPKLTFYKDVTETQRHTVHPKTQEVLTQLRGKGLKISFYENLLNANALLPTARQSTRRTYKEFTRFVPGVKFDYNFFYAPVDYERFEGDFANFSLKKKAEMTAYYKRLDTAEIKALEDYSEKERSAIINQGMTSVLSHTYTCNGRTSYYQMFRDDMQMKATEIDKTTALKRLVVPAYNVAFVKGHQERSIKRAWDRDWHRMASDYRHRSSLVNNGFNVSELDLSKATIADSTNILVIANPVTPYSAEEIDKIKAYIEQGGDVLIAGEANNSQALKDILQLVGISFESQVVVNTAKGLYNGSAPEFLTTFGTDEVELPGFTPLTVAEDKDFDVQPLLLGIQDSISNVAAYTLTRIKKRKAQKIMVLGDADFASDKLILQNKRTMPPYTPNTNFCRNIFCWFTNGEYPLVFEEMKGSDNTINMTNAKEKLYRIIYIWLIPALLLVIGAFIWFRRRGM